MNTFFKLFSYVWPKDRGDIKSRIILALLVLVLAKVLTVLVPYTYKWATDAIVGNNTLPIAIQSSLITPIFLIISYGVGRILVVAFNQLRDALFAKVGQNAVRQIARESFQHLHNLSLRFHLERRTGGLNRLVERGVKGIENIIRFAVLNTIPTIIEFLFIGVIFFKEFGSEYFVVILITVILYAYFTVKASEWRIIYREQMNSSDEDANNKAIDSLLNYETVKNFNNEKIEAKLFDKAMEGYERATIKIWTSLAWLNFGQTLIITVGATICMAMSGLSVVSGDQTVGDFVLVNALLMQLAIPLNFFGFIYREIRQGITDLSSLLEVMKINPEIVDGHDAKGLKIKGGEIKFRNVSFSYEKDREILQNLSFTINSGTSTAIVGPTGAGKSTLSKLLFRFYDVTEGSILLDDQDIRNITQNSLRQNIGVVPQDTVLFNDTIRYNIKYGRLDASDDDIYKVIDQAQLTDFISDLPDGLDTIVGERGLKLSGGEKQRVAIARTLLKSPPILILDEATSALDTLTESEIKGALDNLSQKRTSLIIAHRLSTVIGADKIIVLQRGKIVEEGNHKELLKKDGLYADMWSSQQAIEKAEETLKNIKPEYKKLIKN